MSPWRFFSICHLFWQPVTILVSLFHNIHDHVCCWLLLCFHIFLHNLHIPVNNSMWFLLNKKKRIYWTSWRTVKESSFETELFWKFMKNFVYVVTQTWQSYQICQRKILFLSDKNSPSKPNSKPQFIIRGWLEAEGFYMKITQNCQISLPTSADLCTIIFNGI